MNSTSRSAQSLVLSLIIGAGAALPPAMATETPPAQVDALYERGRDAAKAGRHEEAGEAFSAAFELDPNASLLWNAARSYDKAGNLDRTRALYERYRAHPDANREKVDRANAWLDAHPSSARSAPPRQTQVIHTTSATTQGDATGTVLGWTLCGLGIASAVGGTIAMALAWESQDDTYALRWDQHYADTLDRYAELSSEIETREMAAWMSYGVGVALLASGITLLVTRKTARSSAHALLPEIQINPQSGGVHAAGRWRF